MGGVDITRAAYVNVAFLSAVAEFERDLLIERTQAGLSRTKAAGKALGRPQALSSDQQEEIRRNRAAGVSLGVLSKQYAVSRAARQRVEKRTV